MRKIIFKEIGMENYGPYTEPFIIECPEDSLTLITGPNGVGKTIAMDAMSFTFYGITSKGERGDDVVNNEKEKNCHTWVKFDDSDGNSYVCDRYHKHSKYKNTARLTRNDEEKPYRVGHREVSAEIDRLICDKKTFGNTLMFGQKVKDFFTDLTDTDQKAIFWKLLDLLKYQFYQKTAKTESDETTKSIQGVLNDVEVAKGILENIDQQIEDENQKANAFEDNKKLTIAGYETGIGEINTLIDITKEALDKVPDEDLKPLQEKVFILKGKLDNVGKDAADIKKEVETEAHQKLSELSNTRNQKVQEITAKFRKEGEDIDQRARDASEEYNKQIQNLTEQVSTIQVEIAQLESKIVGNEGRLKDLQKNDLVVGAECPTCLEAITDNSITHIKEIMGELSAENTVIYKEVEKLKNKRRKLDDNKLEVAEAAKDTASKFKQERIQMAVREQEETATVDSRLDELKKQLADLANNTLKERIQDLEVKAQKMQSDLNVAEAKYAEAELNFKKRQEIQDKIREYNTKVDSLKEQIKTVQEKEFDDSTLKNLLNTKNQKLGVIKKSEGKIADINAELDRLAFWKEAFSKTGIPSMLIDQAVPLMNKSMRKYLDLLSNGRYIVTFDTISQTKGGEYRDKFSVNVLDTKTQVNNRKQLSGGQTRLIDIATILTLRDLKAELGEVEFNLFAFDEIFDALDDSNIGYVCGILNTLKESRSLLVVSHRHQDELEADSHIQLT